MLAEREKKCFENGSQVLICRYRQLHALPHWHFEDELLACRSGRVLITCEGQTYELTPGMCFFCRSENVHSISTEGNGDIMFAHIRRILSRQCWLDMPLFRDEYGVYDRLLEMYRESLSKESFYIEKVNAEMMSLLVDIFRNEALSSRGYRETVTVNRYRSLMNYITQRISDITFKEAAAFMNMSESYFSRSFKQMTGHTFSQYMNLVRIDHAIACMTENPDVSMSELMSACGFNTLRNFNRVFKEVTGYPPTKLPADYSLNIRSLSDETGYFSPDLPETEIIESY